MKLKPRPEGGAFPGKGEEVREQNLKASRAPAWALRLEGETVRNPSRLGTCSQVWRGEAAAPGEAEGLTVRPAEELRRLRKRFR